MAQATYDVSSALNSIDRSLSVVNDNVRQTAQMVDQVHGAVNNVDNNLKVVYDEIGQLARDFHEYVQKAENEHNVSLAETRLVKIRQELETKYGYHAETRRTIIGVLQADDLEIVRRDTITTATEELMISAPGYWLAPALVALAAWINDDAELADRAVKEAIRRNDEKTSLLFALICRRADRKASSLKWIQRYLANQHEEDLDRNSVIILDAFASGLLGADTEGIVAKQLDEWIIRLQDKAGFVERQTKQWSDAINLKRDPFNGGFEYLRKYSETWPKLQYVMEGAHLHANILAYFKDIFNQQSSGSALEEQLDEILQSLVTEFDDEELPFRLEEKLNQFIIDYDGDLPRARQSMQVERAAFDTHKDFTQLLTDAAMKPEISHASVSTQKFSVALSRDWIANAYNDVVAKNRMEIPDSIEINLDDFNESTRDGKNEDDLVEIWKTLMKDQEESALAQNTLNAFQRFCLIGGVFVVGIGLSACMSGQVILGLIALIGGAGMVINHYTSKKAVERRRQDIERQFDERLQSGTQIIRATLAEVVDFRSQFAEKDSESQEVVDFLDQIKPEQYIKKLSDATRRIKIAG
jgi:biopolymer transport protein ExbB/TolQ